MLVNLFLFIFNFRCQIVDRANGRKQWEKLHKIRKQLEADSKKEYSGLALGDTAAEELMAWKKKMEK
jgi:hypothetical protein